MEITSNTVEPLTQNFAVEAASTTSSSASTLTADFDTFLNLLTAQLENQDPLEPLESTEFVAQLAQFSSVEQQVATNEALAEMLAKLDGSAAAELSQWLGRQVEAQSALSFDGEPIQLTAEPNARADAAQLVITNVNGVPLGQIPVNPSATEITWDGDLGAGQTAEPGLYRFQLERFSGGARLETEIPKGFAEVTEVRLGSDEVQLVLDGQDQIGVSEVDTVRAGV